MARIEVIFPDAFDESIVVGIQAAWEGIDGYQFTVSRSSEYAVVQMLGYTDKQFNPGFLSQLTRPIEQAVGNSNFLLDLSTDVADYKYRGGEWQY